MAVTIKSKYLGELRCESLHLGSKNSILTDAPLDNKGKGEAFSPTDLLATSLATCMMTVMGIAANNAGLKIDGVECAVEKIMAANPRRVAEIKIEFTFLENNFDENQKQLLRDAAYSCPVAMSLSSDLKKTVIFGF